MVAFTPTLTGPLPTEGARNLMTSMLFAGRRSPLADPGLALLLAGSGVDVLQVLYGDAENPEPRDNTQILVTALLGEPERARTILMNLDERKDGSAHETLMAARAWLNLLPKRSNRRILRLTARSGRGPMRILRLVAEARSGKLQSMRTLLDLFGRDVMRLQPGNTAGARFVFRRWDQLRVGLEGVAGAAFYGRGTARMFPAFVLSELFQEEPDSDWASWWAARRALLYYDSQSKRYLFTELP